MIDALTCGQRAEYNTFVQRHRGDLAAADKQITSHFGRVYNSAGGRQRDGYVTDLANAQSQEAIRRGPSFCREAKPFAQQALALQNSDQVSRFVTEKNVANPYVLTPCERGRPAASQTN